MTISAATIAAQSPQPRFRSTVDLLVVSTIVRNPDNTLTRATNPVYTTRIKQVAHGFADRMGPKDVMSVLYLNGGKSVTTQIRAEVHKAIDQMGPIGNAVVPDKWHFPTSGTSR